MAVGVRLGIYDPIVFYHVAGAEIRRLVETARGHIDSLHQGSVPRKPKATQAYEHCLWLIDAAFAHIEKDGKTFDLSPLSRGRSATRIWPWM